MSKTHYSVEPQLFRRYPYKGTSEQFLVTIFQVKSFLKKLKIFVNPPRINANFSVFKKQFSSEIWQLELFRDSQDIVFEKKRVMLQEQSAEEILGELL